MNLSKSEARKRAIVIGILSHVFVVFLWSISDRVLPPSPDVYFQFWVSEFPNYVARQGLPVAVVFTALGAWLSPFFVLFWITANTFTLPFITGYAVYQMGRDGKSLWWLPSVAFLLPILLWQYFTKRKAPVTHYPVTVQQPQQTTRSGGFPSQQIIRNLIGGDPNQHSTMNYGIDSFVKRMKARTYGDNVDEATRVLNQESAFFDANEAHYKKGVDFLITESRKQNLSTENLRSIAENRKTNRKLDREIERKKQEVQLAKLNRELNEIKSPPKRTSEQTTLSRPEKVRKELQELEELEQLIKNAQAEYPTLSPEYVESVVRAKTNEEVLALFMEED